MVPEDPWVGSAVTESLSGSWYSGRFGLEGPSLFANDGVWRIPEADVEFTGPQEIRAGIERLQNAWECFVQTAHSGAIQLEGDTASGRAYIQELGRMRDGRSGLNYSIYHDRYRRTQDGWKFEERVYEVSYLDTTPLAGSGSSPEAS
ncbi:nuclear transport factor 2 family protein [Streptomyces sp. NBC_00996]|uniref:nuclear transport factor 2 family protein n=1 Tax=Streptomyces sp. NBC_00996 TaxID=2903710 RepID=UPI003869C576|nr:nuclear transport factor 2 family protein [Streptomyces sp. NBC_00996]